MIKLSSVCLGVDFGLTRCGLAVGDENDEYALPLETIPTKDVVDFLVSFQFRTKYPMHNSRYPTEYSWF